MLVLGLSCFAQNQYEVYFQSETDENILLSVMVCNVKEKQAASYASLYAVQSLIFDGIRGSKKRYLPFVQNEKDSFDEHGTYYHDLFDNGGFWTYIIASSIVDKGTMKDKTKFYIVNVNVNYKALRDSLASYGVIRRFGV